MSKTPIDKEITRLLQTKRKLEEVHFPTGSLDKEIDFLTHEFKSGKRWLHQIKEMKRKYRWEYIQPKNKKEYLEKNDCFSHDFNETIECMHCGERYPIAEYIVQRDNLTGNEYICCKNHKKCGGTLIDFMTIRDDEED